MGKFANKLLVECQLTLPVHPGFQKDPQALQDGNAVRFYCCGWWERQVPLVNFNFNAH